MKRVLSYILALSILTTISMSIGCKTAGVYDPVKTAQVEAALVPGVAAAVTAVIQNNQPMKEQLGNYFRAVGGVFAQMVATKEFSPTFLVTAVDKATAGLQVGLPMWAVLAKNTATGVYGILYAGQADAALKDENIPIHLATVVAGGIDQGLKDAGLPGLMPQARATLKLQ